MNVRHPTDGSLLDGLTERQIREVAPDPHRRVVTAPDLLIRAEAGLLLANTLRASRSPAATPLLLIDDALAAYDAAVAPPPSPRLTVGLRPAFKGRDVTLQIGKRGSRWVVEALDQFGNIYDVAFDGYTGVVRCVTRTSAVEFLTQHGAEVGQKLWATP